MPEYTEFNSKLTPFNFTGYDALGLDDMEIINNGYSGISNFPPQNQIARVRRLTEYGACMCGGGKGG